MKVLDRGRLRRGRLTLRRETSTILPRSVGWANMSELVAGPLLGPEAAKLTAGS